MKATKSLYGNQSFAHLRHLGCFSVYNAHINMLEEQLKYEVEHPVDGYVDYHNCKEIEASIKHWRKLIEQAKDN